MANSLDATRALDSMSDGKKDILCFAVSKFNTCDSIQIGKSLYYVEKTKLFPEYYNSIENKCRQAKLQAIPNTKWGRISFSSSHLILVEVFQADGKALKAYSLDLNQYIPLRNNARLESNFWVEIDLRRNFLVLLEGQSCESIGEVPLY